METKGQILKRIRKESGLTQSEIGMLCGMNKSQISKLEKDAISNPDIYSKAYRALGYSTELILKPTRFPYSTEEILLRLKEFMSKEKSREEIDALALYGSCARKEQGPGSDIDIAIKLKRPNLLRFISIENELKELFSVETNVISLTSKFRPGFIEEISKELIYVQ